MNHELLTYNYSSDGLPKTNLQRWAHYLEFITSPPTFTVFGFLTMIASALQRRVWIPWAHHTLYPNIYCCLVGDASTGKGEVIRPVQELLNSFKYLPGRPLMCYDEHGNPQDEDPDISKFANTEPGDSPEEYSEMSFLEFDYASKEGNDGMKDDLLFPSPFDSSSLRGLTKYMANAARIIKYKKDIGGHTVTKWYGHSSATLLLEELTTLIKKDKEASNIITFLNKAWDCGDYRHGTASNGCDAVKSCCLSFLAGTTPDHMAEIFTEGLLAQGISARTLFILDNNKLPNRRPTPLTPTQKDAHEKLRMHLFKLAHLYGPVTFTPEAYEYHMNWFEKEADNRSYRVNQSRRLDYYYGRINMHRLKIAMAVHFADRTDRVITLSDLLTAKKLLDYVEPNMHVAIRGKSRNELSDIMYSILAYIKTNESGWTEKQIIEEFLCDSQPGDTRELLKELRMTLGKIEMLDGRYILKRKKKQ